MSERIAELRETIDHVDHQLVALLSRRFQCAEEIGEIKKAEKIPVLDSSRESIVIDSRKEVARTHEVDEDFCEHIFKIIMAESRRRQAEL